MLYQDNYFVVSVRLKFCQRQTHYIDDQDKFQSVTDTGNEFTECQTPSRRGYSIPKRLFKLTRFKSFPRQLSGHQDMPLLSFVRAASSTLIRCGWVFISARSVENCISVERRNTLNTDLQSLLQNIKKNCSRLNKVYSH